MQKRKNPAKSGVFGDKTTQLRTVGPHRMVGGGLSNRASKSLIFKSSARTVPDSCPQSCPQAMPACPRSPCGMAGPIDRAATHRARLLVSGRVIARPRHLVNFKCRKKTARGRMRVSGN